MALNILLYIFYFHRVLNYKGVLTFGGRVPGIGDFTSILAFGSEPAALRNPQKERDPRFYKHFSLFERACGASEPSKKGGPRFYKHFSLFERACGASEPSKKRRSPKKLHVSRFFQHVFPTFAVHYFFPADPFERGFKIASKCNLILDFDYIWSTHATCGFV